MESHLDCVPIDIRNAQADGPVDTRTECVQRIVSVVAVHRRLHVRPRPPDRNSADNTAGADLQGPDGFAREARTGHGDLQSLAAAVLPEVRHALVGRCEPEIGTRAMAWRPAVPAAR
jgi:hypothetical protein